MAPVRKSLAIQVDGPPRGRGRLKRMWMEVVKRDKKMCNLSKNLTLFRLEWRNRILGAYPNIVRKRLWWWWWWWCTGNLFQPFMKRNSTNQNPGSMKSIK